jgi:hypothetical protein
VTEDDESEVLTIPEAAARLGLLVPEFIRLLVLDGMLIEHTNGGYVPSPHPDLVTLDERKATPAAYADPRGPGVHEDDVSTAQAITRTPMHPGVIAQTHRMRMDDDPVYRMLWETKERAGNTLDAVNDGSGELPWEVASERYETASAMLTDYRARLDLGEVADEMRWERGDR